MNLSEPRKLFPKEGWKAVRNGFGWDYENAAGEMAHWVSALAPSYPDDDNTFQSQFYVYRHGKGGQLLRTGATYRGAA